MKPAFRYPQLDGIRCRRITPIILEMLWLHVRGVRR